MHLLQWKCKFYQYFIEICPRVQIWISSIGSDSGLVPTWQQAPIWTIDGQVANAYHSAVMSQGYRTLIVLMIIVILITDSSVGVLAYFHTRHIMVKKNRQKKQHKGRCSTVFTPPRPRQNGRCLTDDTFKSLCFNENVSSIKVWLKSAPRVQLALFKHWVKQCLGADPATIHHLNQWWFDYQRTSLVGLQGVKDIERW